MLTVFLPKLQELTQVKAVYLRGSRFKETHNPDSDWDFIIVVSKLIVKKPSVENYNIDICLTIKTPKEGKLLWNT